MQCCRSLPNLQSQLLRESKDYAKQVVEDWQWLKSVENRLLGYRATKSHTFEHFIGSTFGIIFFRIFQGRFLCLD